MAFSLVPDLDSNCESSIPEIMESVNEFALTGPLNSEDHERMKQLFKRSQCIFEWSDGPLVQAMKDGDLFLMDEISLADDSVLERLNSVLEPHRLLVLAEKAEMGENSVVEIYGSPGFDFLATMNPGGDYGKKELSPALRNRFTEIWAPPVTRQDDLIAIINSKLQSSDRSEQLLSLDISKKMLSFISWFSGRLQTPSDQILSLRDVLSWAHFISNASSLGIGDAFIHGGHLVIVDGIGVNPLFGVIGSVDEVLSLKSESDSKLKELIGLEITPTSCKVTSTGISFGIDPFFIPIGPQSVKDIKFSLGAPTTIQNCVRVLRALQLRKPVLLEGSPGVGKTSLIENLAAVSGNRLVRINLSEQTDLADLFGSDLPVEDDHSTNFKGPEFAWRDGPLLRAMKNGDWILFDELNLASQQVLEGLNSCLDHRGVVYIPELQREFQCSISTRIFAAQNPQSQGGGRKGLPKSFLNRFSQVFVTELSRDDMCFIVDALHPKINQELAHRMIEFVDTVNRRISSGDFGSSGGPWEFNLRDILRWCELVESVSTKGEDVSDASRFAVFLDMLFVQRMRSVEDRAMMKSLFAHIFGFHSTDNDMNREITLDSDYLRVGRAFLKRRSDSDYGRLPLQLLHNTSGILESLLFSVKMNWMTLLTGPSNVGKTSIIRLLASATGNKLQEFAMNEGVDTIELLGGFEQADLARSKEQAIQSFKDALEYLIRRLLAAQLSERTVGETCSLAESLERLDEDICDDDFQAEASSLLDRAKDLSVSYGVHDIKFSYIRSRLDHWINLKARGVNGSFEWVDGTLVKALENGNWVLIDNVNFCSPSVLDRLNPLLEPGGVLMVNERGLVNGEVKTIYPHPDFRLFLTMDPRNGEISRAMRNRAVELCMTQSDCLQIKDQLLRTGRLDVPRILNGFGLIGYALPTMLCEIHDQMKEWRPESSRCGLDDPDSSSEVDQYNLIRSSKLISERLQRGTPLAISVKQTMEDVYSIDHGCLNVDLENVADASASRLSSIRQSITSCLKVIDEFSGAMPQEHIYPCVWPFVSSSISRDSGLLSAYVSFSQMDSLFACNDVDQLTLKSTLKNTLKDVSESTKPLVKLLLEYRISSGIPLKFRGFAESALEIVSSWDTLDNISSTV